MTLYLKIHPMDKLESLYKKFKDRELFTNDSIVMSGDLDKLKNIINELNNIEM